MGREWRNGEEAVLRAAVADDDEEAGKRRRCVRDWVHHGSVKHWSEGY